MHMLTLSVYLNGKGRHHAGFVLKTAVDTPAYERSLVANLLIKLLVALSKVRLWVPLVRMRAKR